MLRLYFTLSLALLLPVSATASSQISQTTMAAFQDNAREVQQSEKLPIFAFDNYSSLSERFQTKGQRTFVFSPRYKQWAAYDRDGYQVASGTANGGADFCSDINRACRTPAGTFRIGRKGNYHCTSSKYPVGTGGAAMPYCMFFHKGYAIHGSDYISHTNGSHGCIRVQTHAAQWLSQYFIQPGTKVVVLPY